MGKAGLGRAPIPNEMRMAKRPWLTRTLLSGAALILVTSSPAFAELACGSVPSLARQYLKNHVKQRLLTPEIEERAIDTFVRRIDGSRTLLLDSRAVEIRESLVGVFNRMREGDCSQILDLHRDMVKRHQAANAFVEETLAKEDYAVDETVEIVIDPDKRGYMATEEERIALNLKLIHFQISNYLSAGETVEESKRLLNRKYDLRTKRFTEIEDEEVLANFLDSFAVSLDPHSNYLTADYLEDFRIQISLSLEGIGVALTESDGYSTVDRVIPGGAADKLGDTGLRTGDKIIAVAEKGKKSANIIDMPLRDAVKLIRGKKGTTVELTVLRQEGDVAERFELAIVRDKIDLVEQAAKLEFETREVDGKAYKLAVIELPSFYGDPDPEQRQCSDDIEDLLAQVEEEGADGLLIDLSRNGGGLLDHAVKISGFFIRKGEVVGVQNARGQLSVLQDRDDRILYSGPLVVHTSRMSASASEILAGALKDYHRAVITGDDHTFGKGTVQTVTQLPPGQGAIKVTTAVFFRPGGRSTQKDGVHADVVIPTVLSAEDTGEVSQPYALPGETIQPFLSSHANALTPRDRWSYVPVRTIAELSRRSQERVATSEEFGELGERIQKIRDADGIMKLAELKKEREEAKAKEAAEQGEAENEAGAEAAGDAGPGSIDTVEKPADAKEGEEVAKADGETAEDEDELSIQVEEALNVLGDLVALSRSGA
jgi:carboxyl-terminal processing protease